MSFLLNKYVLGAVGALILCLFAMVAVDGWRIKSMKAENKALHGQVAQLTANARLASQQALVSQKSASDHVVVQTQIRTVYQTLEGQAHVIPVATDLCTKPFTVGAERLFNAGVAGAPLSDPPGRADGAASEVDAATFLATALANLEAAQANSAQLEALQGWVGAQAELYNKAAPVATKGDGVAR